MQLLRSMGAIACLVTAPLLSGTAFAQESDISVPPFSSSSLTTYQLQAWDYYLAEESLRFGCDYGDDPRLVNDPRGTLAQLASGSDMEPVRITLRSFLNAGDSVRTLLERNMYIASMECNRVYYYDGDLIGHPVIPYEEWLDILLSKMREDPNIASHIDFIRSTKIASIDARWFWSFFMLNEDHYRLLGMNPAAIVALANMLPGKLEDATPVTAHYHIYSKVLSQGLYIPDANGCNGEASEPNEDLVVDKNLSADSVGWLYRESGIPFRGSWRAAIRGEEPMVATSQFQLVDPPPNSYLNVNRRVTAYPKECS